MASETVSVVFTDLVGSTEILSRLGENRAEELRREFFALLREGAAAHDGREVKNLGDGLMLVFPSASDAVRGTVAIQQLASSFSRTAEVPLLIRAGGSTGDADVVDGDYFGVAVVEAARLCAHCEGGQILVTEAMRHLARDRTGHRYASVGGLELKGLDEEVAAFEVLWEPLEPERPGVPLPGRLERGDAVGFVGRRAELARCEEILKRVDTSERRRVVLFGGE
ncbi:MAG: adenylate/guanylate cyclase domain-containing protein, partial [Acidimicrobiia bacterium]